MKVTTACLATILFVCRLFAAVIGETGAVFRIADLPSECGEFTWSYLKTNVNVLGRFGTAGGPQVWDFSELRAAGEMIQRMDVVPPDDGAHVCPIPDATYAERLTNNNGTVSWSYYSLANDGRSYYGFYNWYANTNNPCIRFLAPTIDLLDPIYYGQSWLRDVSWNDYIFGLPFTIFFTADAHVDAFGTVKLPGYSASALRVQELQTWYVAQSPLPPQYVRYYYWLVPGVGKAVEIVSPFATSPPSQSFTTASRLTRTFVPEPVDNLRISVRNQTVFLDWTPSLGPARFGVALAEDLRRPKWIWGGETSINTWSEPHLPGVPHRFFKVFFQP